MATRETGTVSSGPQVMAAVTEAARVDPTSGRMVEDGPKPAVSTASGGTPPTGPSASERAYEAARPTGYKDRDEAARHIANPTWDPEFVNADKTKGAFVEATAARAGDADKRMVAGTTLAPSAADARLTTGTLTEGELGEITTAAVAQVNPLSDAPRNILKHTLHESWHHAKHHLLRPAASADAAAQDNAVARKMLMAKLWEFRQWHHGVILQRTQNHADIGAEGLTEWKAAGSTTLTSDIDVNLKGARTEQAVGVFNKLFVADGWKHEAGVVYDVNVYAVDFMHKDTFKGLSAEMDDRGREHIEARTKDDPRQRVSAKEGARAGSDGGGVSKSSEMLAERMVQADATLQHVWGLVKMRLYMTAREWFEYTTTAKVAPATLAAVDLRYDAYMTELQLQMTQEKQLSGQVESLHRTGFGILDQVAERTAGAHGSGENIKMAASNRIYEKKLLEMAGLRTQVQQQISARQKLLSSGNKVDASDLDAAIDGNLAMLRDLISECAMFSNEAYVTDGAVNHAVVGLQSKIGISQTRTESMDAFNENVADSLKEIARHGATIGEAAYKAGKYLWRMADAARNLGDADATIGDLYTLGYTLANEIKGGSKPQSELETLAGDAVTSSPLGITTPAQLMGLVRKLAADVALRNGAKVEANGQKRTTAISATKG